MLILGIDPGLASCGWAVVEFAPRILLVEGGTIHTKPNTPVEDRIWTISTELRPHRVGAIAWERQSEAYQGRSGKKRTNSKAREVGKVEGAIIALCSEYGARMAPVTPQQAKKAAAAHGFAGKGQIKSIVAALPKGPAWPRRFSQHCADAVAITMAGKLYLGRHAA